MYRSFTTAFALAAAVLSASAQLTVHQVMVLNEGYYDMNSQTQVVPVTLGTYDPVSGVYQTVATIEDARFGNHVLVEDGIIYVAADHKLLSYDADTYTLLDQTEVEGIRRFAIDGDRIVCTKGEIGGLSNYIEVLDKATLDLVYDVPLSVLPYSCEGVQIVDGVAYVAVNNAFEWGNMVGQVVMLDVATGDINGTIDLGADGINPELVMVSADAIYTVNNKDFSGSSVSKMSQQGVLDYTLNVATNSGCGSSARTADHIYYMEYAENKLARFSTTTDAVEDTLENSLATYGLIDDPINGVLYGTTTDFFSSGDLHVMAYDGTVISTTAVGVSPGRLALDVRMSTGIEEASALQVTVFPNPAQEVINVNLPAGSSGLISVLDATGREVLTARVPQGMGTLDVRALSQGLYTIRSVNGAMGSFMKN
jgi:hypothetical protein